VAGAGNPIAWNRYAYVYDNPVNLTDSSGHFVDTLLDALVIIRTIMYQRHSPKLYQRYSPKMYHSCLAEMYQRDSETGRYPLSSPTIIDDVGRNHVWQEKKCDGHSRAVATYPQQLQ
jgi:hypothetical protein